MSIPSAQPTRRAVWSEPQVRASAQDHRMRTVGRLANRVLDAALPARCPGCGAEGPPLCTACAPALDARLNLPAGIAIGLPSDVPAPLLQLEWCAPFSGVVRWPLPRFKTRVEQRP